MSESNWRELLQPASFRGVPFEVEEESSPIGRRTQLHEFVQRDKPEVEDLGRKTRPYKLTAFVIGRDYFAKRDALLQALDKPGAGELVHPWYGRLTVTATDCVLSHSRREGGMARFDLTFVEGDQHGFPAATVNSGAQLNKAQAALWESAADRYRASMGGIDAARLKIKTLTNSVTAVFGTLQQEFATVASTLRGVTGLVDMLANSPGALVGLFEASFGESLGFASWSQSQRTITRKSSASLELAPAAAGGGADNEIAVAAVRNLVRDALLVQLAADAAQLPALSAPSPVTVAPALEQQQGGGVRESVPVAEDLHALRDRAVEAVWQASLNAEPEHFDALQATRRLLRQHLTRVAQAGVQLQQVTLLESAPALVVAWRNFADATRAGEIIERNGVRHPGFLPPGALNIARE